MQVIDLSKVLEPFKDMWVALTDADRVISSNKSAKKAYEEAVKKGYKRTYPFQSATARPSAYR
jgi:Family of unknown function (DUF5678)